MAERWEEWEPEESVGSACKNHIVHLIASLNNKTVTLACKKCQAVNGRKKIPRSTIFEPLDNIFFFLVWH